MRARSLVAVGFRAFPIGLASPSFAADAIFGDLLAGPPGVVTMPSSEAASRDVEARALRRRHWERLRTSAAGTDAKEPFLAAR